MQYHLEQDVLNFIDKRVSQIQKEMDEISLPERFEVIQMECLKARERELMSLRTQICLMMA